MRVLLIQPPLHESIDTEYVSTQIPINLGYIAASLEQVGAEIKIIDFCVEKFEEEKFLRTISKFNPKIIGFTSLTPSIPEVERLSTLIKMNKSEALVILGGCHASALPEETLEELKSVDVIILGEGESTVVDLYEKVKTGHHFNKIQGIAYRIGKTIAVNPKRPLIENLNELPLPARYLFKVNKYQKAHVSRGFSRKHLRIMELLTSRGCPNSCIFCAGHINYGFKVRFRSFDNIKDEIDSLVESHQINHVSIEDDTFTLNKKLVYQLGRYLRKKGISWNCNARVNTVNQDLLRFMAWSGCKKISFGVESGSPRILKLIKKGITLDQVRKAFSWAKKSGIRFIEGTFILGSHPDETLEDMEMTKKLMFELRPDFASLAILCPFPGTEVYQIMKESKMLSDDPDWSRFTFINNKPPYKRLNHVTSAELVDFQTKVLREYYSHPKYILRQVLKIRTFGEFNYFFKLGIIFLKKFLIFKN